MVRFRLYFNKDKETAYLNEMVGKGYAMKNFFAGFYLFERCRPGEYIYQVDIGEAMFQVSGDYREFMQDMGVEIVGAAEEESGRGTFCIVHGCGVKYPAL